TVRASGPTWSSVHASGDIPARLTRPYVGFSPAMPQKLAGTRIEPPVSLPSATGTSLAATAAPDPLLDPPGTWPSAHGFAGVPSAGLTPVGPKASSWRCVVPTTTAPAARSRATTPASAAAGGSSLHAALPFPHVMPRTA